MRQADRAPHRIIRRTAAAALVAAALGLAATAMPGPAAAHGSLDITARITLPGSYAPPPQRAERIPRMHRHQAWIPGHWEWRPHPGRHAGHRGRGPKHKHARPAGDWVWIPGHVTAARPGWRYVPPQWNRGRHNEWSRSGGVWVRAR